MQRSIRRKGFTLIELITVMAITAVLLTIIALPIVQSFNLTRAAQGFADAQFRARQLISQIEREIANGAAVRDNSGSKGSLVVVVPDNTGAPVQVLLPYTKLDIFKPSAGDPGNMAGTAYIDPDTGKADPTLEAPKGQPNLTGGPGETMVRYFIARRDPGTFAAPRVYNNPWVQYGRPGGGKWLANNASQDNLYVLMRAEVAPYMWVNPGTGPVRVVNTDFFIDGDRDADPNTTGPVYDDPYFMDPSTWATNALPYGAAQPWDPVDRDEMVQHWLARATIVTELSRYDMVMPTVDRKTNEVLFNGNVPVVVPLVRFAPTRINSESASAQLAVRPGEESVNSDKLGPDVYQTPYGSWADATMRVFPSLYNPGTGFGANSAGAPRRPWTSPATVIDMLLDTNDDISLFGSTGQIFNVSNYRELKNAGQPYPFYRSVNWGNVLPTSAGREGFMAMVPEPTYGKVIASFDVREYGVDVGVAEVDRLPSSNPALGPGIATGPVVTPANPVYAAGPGWATYTNVNERFARLYNEWDALWPVGLAPAKDGPSGVKRYIDLRQFAQAGASAEPSPLTPGRLPRICITPGSEEIFGPDQTPGTNYGRLVRYSRVPNVDSIPVGPNQYKINYTDLPEPDWATVGLVGANYDKSSFTANNFLSEIMQARYRVGYVELNSRYGEPIPLGNIFVSYRFQFTEPSDVVSVDYDTTELMEVVLTIRNYPQTSLPNPQMVTVRGSAAVRNKLR